MARFGFWITLITSAVIWELVFNFFNINTLIIFIIWTTITTFYMINTISTVPIGNIGYGTYRGKGKWAIQMAPFAFIIYSKYVNRREFIYEELEICFTQLKNAGAKKIILITWLIKPEELSQILSSPHPIANKLCLPSGILHGFFTLPFHWIATFEKLILKKHITCFRDLLILCFKLPFLFIVNLFRWLKSDKKKNIIKPLIRPWYKYEWNFKDQSLNEQI